jgi:hypothetical protein
MDLGVFLAVRGPYLLRTRNLSSRMLNLPLITGLFMQIYVLDLLYGAGIRGLDTDGWAVAVAGSTTERCPVISTSARLRSTPITVKHCHRENLRLWLSRILYLCLLLRSCALANDKHSHDRSVQKIYGAHSSRQLISFQNLRKMLDSTAAQKGSMYLNGSIERKQGQFPHLRVANCKQTGANSSYILLLNQLVAR